MDKVMHCGCGLGVEWLDLTQVHTLSPLGPGGGWGSGDSEDIGLQS